VFANAYLMPKIKIDLLIHLHNYIGFYSLRQFLNSQKSVERAKQLRGGEFLIHSAPTRAKERNFSNPRSHQGAKQFFNYIHPWGQRHNIQNTHTCLGKSAIYHSKFDLLCMYKVPSRESGGGDSVNFPA